MSSIAIKPPWRLGFFVTSIGWIILTAALAIGADGLGGFVEHLTDLEPRVQQGVTDPRVAGDVINELDADEGTFAHFTTVSGESRAELIEAYNLLDRMLGRMYETYHKKHDECLTAIGNGAVDCDYSMLEQLELRALYPLSWLRFHGSILFNSPEVRRRMLKQAAAGFTQSALVIVSPELIRENLLGRGYCERDMGQFDRSHYTKAIADFREVMRAGAGTAQYRAAQQGLATTYAAMGEVSKAAALSSHLAQTTTVVEMQGAQTFRLQELFKAEATDPTHRAQFHREAVELLRNSYGNRKEWSMALASVVHDVANPEAEFGASKDPFELYLLAEVLASTHHQLAAAKYYLAAARGGQYPQGYKYAIDIYYSQGRLDLIDAPLQELANQRHNTMADWAAYMRFKIARTRWERSGMSDPRLNDQWIARARDYVDQYPRGKYAYEPRFRLAELLQRQGKYADAAAQYDRVKGGDSFYDFSATFKAAECRYLELGGAAGKAGKPGAMAAASKNELTAAVIAGLRSTVMSGPAIEKRTPAERQFVHTARGRATYMLATMLEAQPRKNYAEIAELLDGFDSAYPQMNANFDDVTRWRLEALERTGQYAQAEVEITRLLAPGRRPAPSGDYIKTLGLELWKRTKARTELGDKAGALADARLTALLYQYFEKQVAGVKMNAKSLTGTLSILGQAYVMMNDSARAKVIFEQVVAASPASPDANAGLARLAQAQNDYRQASDLWTRVESEAAESDDLWYEARYNLALIYAADGNLKAACGKLAETRSEHPSLGSQQMKVRWDGLQRRLCLHQGIIGEDSGHAGQEAAR
ncbi:MAG TPA: tetratricopeptide repeat protein [Candidatus Binataceae bacterium]|nr:tetratricopeptide repeat protein [Candidatus Binataceae bacterium]